MSAPITADFLAGNIGLNTYRTALNSIADNRAKIAEWNAIADREVIDMISSVNGGMDVARGFYRIGVNGEHTVENYASAGGGIAGSAFGATVKFGGRFIPKTGLIDYFSEASQALIPRQYIPKATRDSLSPAPAGKKNPHLHHILELNGRAGEHRALVREGQEILRDVGIDPMKGVENLLKAPNKGHTKQAALDLVTDLRMAAGDHARVVEVLTTHGEKARKR